MTEYEAEARKRGNVEPIALGSELDIRREAERPRLVAEYSWAIPNEKALQTIAAEGPILEVGAGNGYWAWELRKRGVDVLAFDPKPYKEGQYIEIGPEPPASVADPEIRAMLKERNRVYRRKWADVEEGDHTVVAQHRDRNLFICWPSWGEPWATEAVERCHAEVVLFVGELGGSTGDEGLVPALCRDFKLTKTVEIPNYWGVHDVLTVWRR